MFDLEVISPILLWTSIAIYAAAFVAYAFDLARRSQLSADAATVQEFELVGAGTRTRGGKAATAPETPADRDSARPASDTPKVD